MTEQKESKKSEKETEEQMDLPTRKELMEIIQNQENQMNTFQTKKILQNQGEFHYQILFLISEISETLKEIKNHMQDE